MFCNKSFASGVAVALEVVAVLLVAVVVASGRPGRGPAIADGSADEEEEEDGMPRISASAVELDAAMRLAAMMRARCVRGLKAE